VESVSDIPPELVYDFTTISKNHSFVANGIVSHNCMPSRMTINQLMESVLGKSCALEGTFGDATPFTSSSVGVANELCDRLGMNGFERTGTEPLYNGMTGEFMGDVFIGPVYYQRLKHLVSEKIHARAQGPNATMTRQPLEGRSREGGLRFGEMERDCIIAHGASRFLKERLFEQSDPYNAMICEECGNFATSSTKCKSCNTDKIAKVNMPYVSKLVIQELNAMMIKCKIKVKA
jgi:DNA-directed RNA polymerase II subunit RPB2